jgi:hypothetical protein
MQETHQKGTERDGREIILRARGSSHEFEGIENMGFIIGSAVKHPCNLVLGAYSVHTSGHALEKG